LPGAGPDLAVCAPGKQRSQQTGVAREHELVERLATSLDAAAREIG